MYSIQLKKELQGTILDIGGGGEGIIGRIYGQNVLAIDNEQAELDEAPDTCPKILMDAACLHFDHEAFDHVTFFFSLMYMDSLTQPKALSEAARVLNKGGSLTIWDAEIESAYPNPFLIDLDIDAAGEKIQTTYGIVKKDACQNAQTFAAICKELGLLLKQKPLQDGWFHLVFQKI